MLKTDLHILYYITLSAMHGYINLDLEYCFGKCVVSGCMTNPLAFSAFYCGQKQFLWPAASVMACITDIFGTWSL